MGTVREHRTVVAISPLDLPHGNRLLVMNCEDCACAVTAPAGPNTLAVHERGPRVGASTVTCAPDVLVVGVDAQHSMLFNPRLEGGMLVVNRAAEEIFLSFRRPILEQDVRERWPGSTSDFDAVFGKLLSLGMLEVGGQERRTVYAHSEVLTVWLHVTNDCNLGCPYCYVNKSPERMSDDVAFASVDRVVRSARSHSFSGIKLKYAGGEASLNHGLVVTLQQRARELTNQLGLSLEATILSNGVALSGAFIEFLKRENVKVMISLDGIGEAHDVQRPFVDGRGSFARVDHTIRKLLDQGLRPHLSVTISNRNCGGVADVVGYALKLGLTFSLNLFRDNDCAAKFEDLQYEEGAIISSLTEAFAVIEENLPPWSVLGAVLDRGQLIRPRERSCGVGQDYVVVDQRGGVAKCHMEIEKTIGDVFTSDPVELVRDDRTLLNLTASEKEGCRSCTWKNWCSGGCSVATFRATGRFDVKSPNCQIYKVIYPMALRLEALRLLKYQVLLR